MKNIIILNQELDCRKGGPSGYLSNLKYGLDNIKSEKNINFIVKDKIQYNSSSNKNNIKLKKNYKSIEEIRKILWLTIKYRINIKKLLKGRYIDKCDLVHFHNILDFYHTYTKCKNSYKILTTHNPECFSLEFINSLEFKNNKEYNNLKKIIIKIQEFALKNADSLIFPCEDALEPYLETIPNFEQIIKNKDIKYNFTGCKKLEYKVNKEEFRRIYNISKETFVISYVGRHNSVKGYDIFIEAAKYFEKTNEDIIFVTAGVGDIETPKLKNIIDIGWTNDPGSIINASDLFILPNRRTYFDLILLEVMSIGIPALVSNTGGNKTVYNLSNGIFKFEKENIDDLINSINNLRKDNELKSKGKINKDVYEELFTVEKFAERYLNILNEINQNRIDMGVRK